MRQSLLVFVLAAASGLVPAAAGDTKPPAREPAASIADAVARASRLPLRPGIKVTAEMAETDPTMVFEGESLADGVPYKAYQFDAKAGRTYYLHVQGLCKCFGFKKNILQVRPAALLEPGLATLPLEATVPATLRHLMARQGFHEHGIWQATVRVDGAHVLVIRRLPKSDAAHGKFSLQLVEQDAAPTAVNWDKGIRAVVETALKYSPDNPVAAALIFKSLWDFSGERLAYEESVAIGNHFAALRPRALHAVAADLEKGNAEKDARLVGIAHHAKTFLEESLVERVLLDVYGLREERSLEGWTQVWKVKLQGVQPLEGRYSEDGLSLAPADGHRLVRVKALVENVSASTDPPYTLAALKRDKAVMLQAPAIATIGDKPHRWLDDTLVFLLGADGQIVPCLHVCKGSPLASMSVRVDGRMIFSSLPLASGDSTPLDVVFAIPANADLARHRLVIVGAAPVTLVAN